MKYVYGLLLLVFLIFTVDMAIGNYQAWRRERNAKRWGMQPGAFKQVTRNWQDLT